MYRKCIDSRMASQHRPPLPTDKEIGSCSQNYGPCIKPRGMMDCHHFSSHSLSLFQAVEGRDFSLHAALGSLGKTEPPLHSGPRSVAGVSLWRARCVVLPVFVPREQDQDLSCFSSEPDTLLWGEELFTRLCLFRHFILKYLISGWYQEKLPPRPWVEGCSVSRRRVAGPHVHPALPRRGRRRLWLYFDELRHTPDVSEKKTVKFYLGSYAETAVQDVYSSNDSYK